MPPRPETAKLLRLVYDELRKLAAARMAAERPGQTLDATALVHEAYMRLVGGDKVQPWHNRGHFFSAAAEAMKRILVDIARKKSSRKHGGGLVRVPLEEIEIGTPQPTIDLLAVNDALEKLDRLDKACADLVKLRYFAGLTLSQAADALGISSSTADRQWAYARAWLLAELQDDDSGQAH
jgi:RNA polymerase sigma factor (TIGR02999 family)